MTESPMYLLADEMVTKYFLWPNIKNCIVVANIFVCDFNEMIHNGETDPICVTEQLKNSVSRPSYVKLILQNSKKKFGIRHFLKIIDTLCVKSQQLLQ